MKLKVFLLAGSLIFLVGCTKKEESPTRLPDHLKGEAYLDGAIRLNGEKVEDFMEAYLNLRDSIIEGPSLSLNVATYELVEEEFFLNQYYFTDHMLLGDTTYFTQPFNSQYGPGHCGFNLMNIDYAMCKWIADSTGWCFVQKLDASSYAMHLEAKVIKEQETCIADRGYGDTVDLVIKGVLREDL